MRKSRVGAGILLPILFLISCASTKKATIPTAWNSSVNWENYHSAEITPTEHILIQNDEDLLILDGARGSVLVEEIVDSGIFGELKKAAKQAVTPFSADNNVKIQYWHRSLAGSNTLLLFDRVSDEGTIRAVDLNSGEELWTSEEFPWSLEYLEDEADIAVNVAFKNSLRSAVSVGLASEVLLQTRMINAMIQEVPEKNAFLFSTVDQNLYLVDSNTGEAIWKRPDFESSGIAAVTYLADRDQFLLAGSMGGLKDVLSDATDKTTMKQLALIDAETGDLVWKTAYKGRSEQVNTITRREDLVQLYFKGGSVEIFNFMDGTRLFGTRDEALAGDTQLASFTTDYNLMETPETTMPKMEGNAVYAVNPTKARAVGLPDKQIVKYNFKTGETLWEKELEKVMDIRDMLLRNDKVIVRLSPTGSDTAGSAANVVGGHQDLGFYAFSKGEGKLLWQLTEPFGKNLTNVHYEGDFGWAANSERMYKFSLETGKVLADSLITDKNLGANYIRAIPRDRLLVLGSDGIAVVEKSNLRTVFAQSMKGKMQNFRVNDKYAILKMKRFLPNQQNIYVFDLDNPAMVSSFTLELPGKAPYGNFGMTGYYPTGDFRQVVTLTPAGIKSYEIH